MLRLPLVWYASWQGGAQWHPRILDTFGRKTPSPAHPAPEVIRTYPARTYSSIGTDPEDKSSGDLAMRCLGFILFACFLAGCGANHSVTEGDDTRNWQGTWKLVSCIANGESQIADMQWIVSGARYTIRLNRQSGVDPYPFKLDPKQKHIDVHHHDTPKGTYGGHLKGIYDIQGNSLKVCYDLKGQRYPNSFDAGHGSAQVVYQFQRQ
jgi:uncharacterized protein (TIGR03067 family)